MTNEELLALVKRNPVSVGCGLFALVIGVLIYHRMDLLPEAAIQLEQKVAEGERFNANVNNAAQLPEQLAAITEARLEMEKRLIRAIELPKNLQYFYRLEAETGVKLLNLTQNPAPPAKPGAKLPLSGVGFTIAFQGPYFVALEFLRRLETGVHFSRTMSASMATTAGNRNGPVTVSFSLELLSQP